MHTVALFANGVPHCLQNILANFLFLLCNHLQLSTIKNTKNTVKHRPSINLILYQFYHYYKIAPLIFLDYTLLQEVIVLKFIQSFKGIKLLFSPNQQDSSFFTG